MRQSPGRRSRAAGRPAGCLRGQLLLAACAWVLIPAQAGAREPRDPDFDRAAGPTCTPLGCAGATGSAASTLAGFGLATLAIAHLARRHPR